MAAKVRVNEDGPLARCVCDDDDKDHTWLELC